MHDLEGVQNSHPHYQLLRYLGSVILIQVLVVFHEFKQVLPFYELGYDVDVRFGLDALLELKE